MKLEPDDYPLVAQGNRIYSQRMRSQIAMCWDDEMAADMARRLNEEAEFIVIPRLDR